MASESSGCPWLPRTAIRTPQGLLVHLHGSLQFWSIFMVLFNFDPSSGFSSILVHLHGSLEGPWSPSVSLIQFAYPWHWKNSQMVCQSWGLQCRRWWDRKQRERREGRNPQGEPSKRSLTCDRFFEEGCCTNARCQMTRWLLTRWPDDSWPDDQMTPAIDQMTRWLLTRWPDDSCHWPDDQMTPDQMTRWLLPLTRWPDDHWPDDSCRYQMTRWLLTRWLDDQMTPDQMTRWLLTRWPDDSCDSAMSHLETRCWDTYAEVVGANSSGTWNRLDY